MADTTSIDGSNGSFVVKTNNDLSNPLAPSITIDYTVIREKGKPKVACAKIVFVQTVKNTIGGTVVKPPSALHSPDLRRGNHSDPDQTAAGVYVDHFFCSPDPYYNQDAADQGTTDGDGRPAEMYDAPSFNEADLPQPPATATKSFEVCAICADGGAILDCITWTFEQARGGRGKITLGGKAGAASAEFTGALELFTKTHQKDGKWVCPDKEPTDGSGDGPVKK
jgi:hypothetical protein